MLFYTDYELDLLDYLKDFGFSTKLYFIKDLDSDRYRIDGIIFLYLKNTASNVKILSIYQF